MPKGTLYEYEGEKRTAAAWLRDPRHTAGISDQLFAYRLKAGWSMADALTVPKGERVGAKQAGKPRARAKSAKKAAGEKLNDLFEQRDTKPAKPPAKASAPAADVASSGATTVDALVAQVARLEEALPALRAGANALAVIHGLPLPYPTETA